jgi:MFS family permease
MKNETSPLGDRLIAVEQPSAHDREKLNQELHAMLTRELTFRRRFVFAIVAVLALAGALLCGFLALTEPDLPIVPRIGLGTGTLFGIGWMVVAARLAWRGTMDARMDSRRIAAMVWIFTVLMMVFFLIVGMSSEDRLLGLTMIANGLAFLIGAAVYWLTHRIEQAELAVREKLLRIELRLAELCEK